MTGTIATTRSSAAGVAARRPSSKVAAGTVAGAASTLFWTVATSTFWRGTFDSATLAGLVSATTTLLAGAAAYVKLEASQIQ